MLISYAQNFEDVILWRALKDVDRGFYVDIGAQDPITDSVSLCFYEAGWRGVHVEPSPHFAARIRAARPDEKVIGAVVGQSSGLIKFYESVKTGLSTCDAVLAERHTAAGFEFQETTAPCVTLSQVLDGCVGHEIHWLKIDVEGFEAAVIDSWLPSPVRPWIVVVESVKPITGEPTFGEWEPTLLGLGYAFVYFDGLNRFYLSEQHPELAHAFGAGPNVFDDFVLSGGNSFTTKLDRDLASSHEAQQRLAAEVQQRKLENNQLDEQRKLEYLQLDEQRKLENNQIDEQRKLEYLQLERRLDEAARASTETSQQHERETHALGQELVETGRASAEARQQHERETSALEAQLVEAARASAEARQQLEARVAELDASASQGLNAVANLQLEVAGLRGSASWRITAPLRWVHSKSIARLPAPRTLAGVVLARLSPYPKVIRCGRVLVRPLPRLRARLEALALEKQNQMSGSVASSAVALWPATEPAAVGLSRSARLVYAQLKAARQK